MTGGDVLKRAQTLAPEIVPFLEGDERSALRMPRCDGCRRLQWPPRPRCSDCGGDHFTAESVDPVGELYSWTVTHRAPAPECAALVPYTVVVVTLDVPEGTRILGRLRETNRVPELSLGMRMRGFREAADDGLPLLTWSVE